MREPLQRFWQDRTPRERRIIATGAAAIALGIAYAYLWLPIARERERMIDDVPHLRTQAQNMRADALLVERLRTDIKTALKDVSSVVARFPATRQQGASPPEIITEANGRVRVVFTSVRADDWLGWLSPIALKRIRIDSVRIDALEETGMIKATVIFSSGDP